VDVCIVGGGIVGTALACTIRSNPLTAHLSVALADRAAPPDSAWLDDPPPTPEPRVSALTPASVALLRDVGAWDRIEQTGRACAFRGMQVWDASAMGHVRYDATEVGANELGHVVENRVVHTALHEAAVRLGVQTSQHSTATALELPTDGGGDLAKIEFQNLGEGEDAKAKTTTEVRARLVVGADGPTSNVRTLAGLRAAGWRYGLKAAVGTVVTDDPHRIAWQRFLPTGPLALLPVTNDGRVSNVVWTTTPTEAGRLCALTDDEFASEVDAALRGEGKYSYGGQGEVGGGENKRRYPGFTYGFEGKWLMGEAQERLVEGLLKPATEAAIRAVAGSIPGGGDEPPAFELPPRVVAAAGPRGSFPLATQLAGRYALRRLALVGDAAHQVHPLGWSRREPGDEGRGAADGCVGWRVRQRRRRGFDAFAGEIRGWCVGGEFADDGGAGRAAEAVRVGHAGGGVGEGRGARGGERDRAGASEDREVRDGRRVRFLKLFI
jgi:ubiquinone biosynthesis monooxygenase Coq6